jgi:hypothetical protein
MRELLRLSTHVANWPGSGSLEVNVSLATEVDT